jgi:glucokinase
MSELAIGIDMGATHIKGVVIDAGGKILHQIQTDTVDQEGAWKDAVAATLQALIKKSGASPGLVGLSAPGLANANNDRIAVMPGRLEGLENFMWSDFLKTSMVVLNDAHAATLAEAKFGAGKNKKDMILLTLGSGVGGGIVINGTLHQGLIQRAGHMGHSTVNADTQAQDVTGMVGSIEDAIGNLTVGRRSFDKYSTTAELVRAYEKGEPIATFVWLKAVKDLASAICSYINIISPELVILSGGISLAGKSLFEPLRAFVELFEWKAAGTSIPIVPAAFGEFAGAIGAAAFALQKQNKLD